MFTIIVYVRICIVIHLFFEKTKTHSRKDSVYRVFFFKNEASKYIYMYILEIYISIYILQLGRVINRGGNVIRGTRGGNHL